MFQFHLSIGLILFVSHLLLMLAIDVKPQKEHYKPVYSVYHNMSSIALTLGKLVKENSDIIRHVQHEKYISKQRRQQFVLHITNFASHSEQYRSKVNFLLSFGEHAREFLPVESLVHFLRMLVMDWRTSKPAIDLNQVSIFVIALANPDGRQYVEQTENFCWRGTLSGVDLNRNFDWEFGGKGSSGDPQDEEFRGPKPFSEEETFVYRDLTEKFHFDGFISFHSGTKQIYIPFADTRSRQRGRVPANLDEMTRLAKELSAATVFKHEYGQAASLNDYTADGTIFDYMAGRRKIPFTYAIELWGPDKHMGPSCFDLFNPPNDKLQEVVSDMYPLYVKFFQYITHWKAKLRTTMKREGSIHSYLPREDAGLQYYTHWTVPSLSPGLLLLCLLVTVTVVIGLQGKYFLCRRIYNRRRVISLKSLSSTLSLNLFHT